MELRVITWNLFHGRDRAPRDELHTWRSRLLRVTERNDTHAQVNRDLFDEFATVLAEADWDVAMLQECPPRWAETLATRCEAEPHLVLTSRNLPPPLDVAQRVAARLSPDLIASWEGGSNLTLARGRHPGHTIAERRETTLATTPEARRMAFTRLAAGVAVANIHASGNRALAEREVESAAAAALEWAGEDGLLFGGDLNVRPRTSGALFDSLARDGLTGVAEPGSIDHLLSRGLEAVDPPSAWPAERREVPEGGGQVVRLSDHAPVEAMFRVPEATTATPS